MRMRSESSTAVLGKRKHSFRKNEKHFFLFRRGNEEIYHKVQVRQTEMTARKKNMSG